MSNWFIGKSYNILWEFPDVLSNIKIELSRDNGNSWETITLSTPNTSSYTWIVTAGTPVALFKISGLVYIDPIDESTIDFTDILAISNIFQILKPISILSSIKTGNIRNFIYVDKNTNKIRSINYVSI